jgi:hypothetical protein
VSSPRSNKKQLGLALGGAALATIVVGVIFLGGTGASVPERATTDVSSAQAAQAVTQTEDEAEPFILPTVTYDVYLARDPFEPVRTPPVTAAGSTTDGGTVPVPADGTAPPPPPPAAGEPVSSPTDPSPSEPGTLPPTNGEAACQGQDEVVCDGQVVTLAELTSRDGQRAVVVQVDSSMYTVTEGEVFARYFRLLRIESDGALFGYGDETFVLRVGGRTLK